LFDLGIHNCVQVDVESIDDERLVINNNLHVFTENVVFVDNIYHF